MKDINEALQLESIQEVITEIIERRALIENLPLDKELERNMLATEVVKLNAWCEALSESKIKELDCILSALNPKYVCDGYGFDSNCEVYMKQRHACYDCGIYRNNKLG